MIVFVVVLGLLYVSTKPEEEEGNIKHTLKSSPWAAIILNAENLLDIYVKCWSTNIEISFIQTYHSLITCTCMWFHYIHVQFLEKSTHVHPMR